MSGYKLVISSLLLMGVCLACGKSDRPLRNPKAVAEAQADWLEEQFNGRHLMGNISYKIGKETEAIDQYLGRGFSLSAPDNEGLTPLMRCAQNDFADLATAFIARGASVNDTCPGIEVIQGDVLLSFDTGPIPNPLAGQRTKSDIYRDWTALMIAVDQSHYRTAEVLLLNGASVHIRDRNGTTPLSIARMREDSTIIALVSDTRWQ